ncbi:MAG: hypothetical protein J0I98_21195 [Mesorhizobium sp.]|nr:Wzz/FepE/Etk N-terminal domain-containing protein [Mesorhizobium sp.]MBN9245300.1 hypothetical protein [Mesorhizobium sp.]
MDIHQEAEIDLRHVILRLWRGWPILLFTSIIAVAIGMALYFVLPRSYRSQAVILPISQTQYSEYLNLIANSALPDALKGNAQLATTFAFSRDDLLNEFISSLQSSDLLMRVVEESGVARKEGQQKTSEADALRFIRDLRITPPNDRKPGFDIDVRAKNEDALNEFIKKVLNEASADAATRIRDTVVVKIKASENIRKNAIHNLDVEIKARRDQEENARKDEIAKLSEQKEIAETVGIVAPVGVSPPSDAKATPMASAQVIGAQQPPYFQGTTALNEQIDLLKSRTSNDPFTGDLRNLERQIYILENDNQAATLGKLLEESPLKDPQTAPIASFNVTMAKAMKTFPRLSIFGIGSVVLGLLIGAGIVLLRDETNKPNPALS